MSVSGISPSTNEPSEFGLTVVRLQSNIDADQELMVGVLRRLPNVSVLDRSLPNSDKTNPTEIELEITWQLDANSPLLDFVSQLLDLLRRTTISQGVSLNKKLVGKLDRIADHAHCVAESIETIRISNKTLDISGA